MTHTKVTTDFYLHLLEFLFSVKHQLVTLGSAFGLTSLQVITLLLINPHRSRPMKSFCTLYNCDASNITGIIDGLERKGLVSRQPDPKDRRLKLIKLETAGSNLQTEILKRLVTANSLMFAPLSETETQHFVTVIEKLAAHSLPRDI